MYFTYLLVVLSLAAVLAPLSSRASAKPLIPKFELQCYDDNGTLTVENKNNTCFKLGERAFADAVENFADEAPAFQHRSPTIKPSRNGKKCTKSKGKPDDATGAPKKGKYVSLGSGGSIILHFKDNVLVNREGLDLKIFTDGTKAEEAEIWISADGKKFYFVGKTATKKVVGEEGTYLTSIDIGKAKLGKNKRYTYVKIVDIYEKIQCHPASGVDINAVGAIHSDIALRGVCQFDHNHAQLDQKCRQNLKKLTSELKSRPVLHLLIEGHADSEGDKGYNEKLSENRANAVKKKLLSLLPALKGKITTSPEGEANPSFTNKTKEGRKRNRRADIILSF